MILGSVFSATSTHSTSVSSTLSVLAQTRQVNPPLFRFPLQYRLYVVDEGDEAEELERRHGTLFTPPFTADGSPT